MTSEKEVNKVLEELLTNPDDYMPTFSEEIAEKARQELLKAFSQFKESQKENNDRVEE